MGIIQGRDILEGRGNELALVSIITPIIALCVVTVRIAARASLGNLLGHDDTAIVLSMASLNTKIETERIFSISLCVVNYLSVYYGIGKHIATLELSQVHNALLNFWICQIVYKFSINLTKLSILLLYLRIFVGRTFKRFACGVILYVLTYGSASIIATIFQCQPVRRAFDHTVPGRCLDVTAFWYSNASANVLGDMMIFLLPWPLIYRLQLPPREKYILCLIFGLGIFVIATSILRMTTLKVSSKNPDVTYGTMVSTLWTTIETNTAIVCACLPTLKAPLAKWFPRLFSRSSSSCQYNRSGSRRATPYVDEAIQLSVEAMPPGTIARRTEVDVQILPKSESSRRNDNFETGRVGRKSFGVY